MGDYDIMTTLFLIIITIIWGVKEELDIRRKRREGAAASRKRIEELNKSMAKLKELQHKDYTKR